MNTRVSEIREGLKSGYELGMSHRLALPRSALRGRDGMRTGAAAGSSLDFHDYRDYHLGDDLRHLDWGVYARSDREVVKLFREEVAPHLDIVLDSSLSMNLRSTSKATAAAMLAALCATAAAQSQCTHTLWLTEERLRALPTSNEPPPLWPEFEFSARMSPGEAVLAGSPLSRKNSVRIFISDLLWPGEPAALLSRLSMGAAALNVVQLLANEERNPAGRGYCRLEDSESGDYADIFLDAASISAYRSALSKHCETWESACRSGGVIFSAIIAEELVFQNKTAPLLECGLLETL